MAHSVRQISIQSTETDEFAQRFRDLGWQHERTQLEAGKSEGRLQIVHTPHLVLICESHSKALLAASVIPPDQFAAGVLANGHAPQKYGGRRFDESNVVTATPEDGCDMATDGPLEFDYFSIDRGWIEQISMATYGHDVLAKVPGPKAMPSHGRVANDLRRAMARTMKCLRSAMTGQAATDEIDEWFALRCLDVFSSLTPQQSGPTECGGVKATIVAAARDFIESHLDNQIRMSDICSHVHTSIRYLQLAFREQMGVLPYRYIMLRRLHRARTLLQAGDGNETTVTDIALKVNWGHLGRFSSEYRRLFGETPADTLRSVPRQTNTRGSLSHSHNRAP